MVEMEALFARAFKGIGGTRRKGRAERQYFYSSNRIVVRMLMLGSVVVVFVTSPKNLEIWPALLSGKRVSSNYHPAHKETLQA
jgi:hypothetical protein